jgi:hypothetical protein
MKKLLLLASLAAAVSLAGCGTTSTTLTNDIASIEAQVQADTNVLCGFVPTAATIAAFIPGFGTIAASAATIAEGVCSAIAAAPVVQPQSARMRASLAASGADTQVTTARTPSGPVAVVGHFTR